MTTFTFRGFTLEVHQNELSVVAGPMFVGSSCGFGHDADFGFAKIVGKALWFEGVEIITNGVLCTDVQGVKLLSGPASCLTTPGAPSATPCSTAENLATLPSAPPAPLNPPPPGASETRVLDAKDFVRAGPDGIFTASGMTLPAGNIIIGPTTTVYGALYFGPKK